MVDKIANQNQQPYKVIVAPTVIRKVDETIRRIQLKAVAKGDPTLWLWADHLGDEVANAIIRLYGGDIGGYPTNYPEFADAGYRRLRVYEYWNLFYLVDNQIIRVLYFIDSRENQRKYQPVKKQGSKAIMKDRPESRGRIF